MVFHEPENQFLLRAMKFFCKNWLPHNVNNGYCKNTWLLYNFEFYVDCIDERAGQLEYGVEAIGPNFCVNNIFEILLVLKQNTVLSFTLWVSKYYPLYFTVTTSKKNTIILKNTILPRQKRILQLLVALVETIFEIRKNHIFLT